MDKIIRKTLGGQERRMDVGKFWFTKYYGQASGDDPLNGTSILVSPERQFDFVVNMVFAGLKCHAKVNKTGEEFDKSQVEDWIGELETEEISALITSYIDLNKSDVKGELLAPAPEQ